MIQNIINKESFTKYHYSDNKTETIISNLEENVVRNSNINKERPLSKNMILDLLDSIIRNSDPSTLKERKKTNQSLSRERRKSSIYPLIKPKKGESSSYKIYFENHLIDYLMHGKHIDGNENLIKFTGSFLDSNTASTIVAEWVLIIQGKFNSNSTHKYTNDLLKMVDRLNENYSHFNRRQMQGVRKGKYIISNSARDNEKGPLDLNKCIKNY